MSNQEKVPSYGMYTDEGNHALNNMVLEIRSVVTKHKQVMKARGHKEYIDTAVREIVCDEVNQMLLEELRK